VEIFESASVSQTTHIIAPPRPPCSRLLYPFWVSGGGSISIGFVIQKIKISKRMPRALIIEFKVY
jgi:hypothetical protein